MASTLIHGTRSLLVVQSVCVDNEDIVYCVEHNGGLVSIMDLDGKRLAQWGSMTHRSCHGVWVDSHKDLYIVEPYEGSQGSYCC